MSDEDLIGTGDRHDLTAAGREAVVVGRSDIVGKPAAMLLINANAINNLGQITGYGTHNGFNHAFLLTPK